MALDLKDRPVVASWIKNLHSTGGGDCHALHLRIVGKTLLDQPWSHSSGTGASFTMWAQIFKSTLYEAMAAKGGPPMAGLFASSLCKSICKQTCLLCTDETFSDHWRKEEVPP